MSTLRASMRPASFFSLALISTLMSGCARHIPEPSVLPGTPHVSWVIMSGDRDTPDRDFVCQSDPREECVVTASRPDAQVFSNVHFYYHGVGSQTRYEGSIEIGFFQGTTEAHTTRTSVTMEKNESIQNHSVVGIVTSTPGTYAITFSLAANVADTRQNHPIRDSVQIVVK
jgi:hypothetical protein